MNQIRTQVLKSHENRIRQSWHNLSRQTRGTQHHLLLTWITRPVQTQAPTLTPPPLPAGRPHSPLSLSVSQALRAEHHRLLKEAAEHLKNNGPTSGDTWRRWLASGRAWRTRKTKKECTCVFLRDIEIFFTPPSNIYTKNISRFIWSIWLKLPVSGWY